ncbi:hypothetical protein H2201_009109, partial [Coniosporium apollinis]
MSDSHSPTRRPSRDRLEDYQTDVRNRGRNPEPPEGRDVGGEAGGPPVVSNAPPHLRQHAIAEAQIRAPYGFQQQQPPPASTDAAYPGLSFPQPHSYPPYPSGPADFAGGQLPGAQSQPAVFASATPFRPNRPA